MIPRIVGYREINIRHLDMFSPENINERHRRPSSRCCATVVRRLTTSYDTAQSSYDCNRVQMLTSADNHSEAVRPRTSVI